MNEQVPAPDFHAQSRKNRTYVCRICRTGPMALADLSTHVCDVNHEMVHYSIGPGLKQCGAQSGKEDVTGALVDCPQCRHYLNRKTGGPNIRAG